MSGGLDARDEAVLAALGRCGEASPWGVCRMVQAEAPGMAESSVRAYLVRLAEAGLVVLVSPATGSADSRWSQTPAGAVHGRQG